MQTRLKPQRPAREVDDARRQRTLTLSMRVSLTVGVGMLVLKFSAYVISDSAAILSDVSESVVHQIAVGFAAFSLWLSRRPTNRRYQYGYDRIEFLSAGFEGL
jgi:divalent metal cation (Fe/Co/Zn/Cd) transporter